MIRFLLVQRTRRHQHGIGMIEVLIAVLVVSIGFLGMAALQARALATNNSAMARSMATIASYSILDAMRADIVNAKKGNYNTATPIKASSCGSVSAPSALATSQLTAWCNQLGQALGAVDTTTGTVDCSVVGDCTVTIQFDDSRAGTVGNGVGSSTQKVATEAGL